MCVLTNNEKWQGGIFELKSTSGRNCSCLLLWPVEYNECRDFFLFHYTMHISVNRCNKLPAAQLFHFHLHPFSWMIARSPEAKSLYTKSPEANVSKLQNTLGQIPFMFEDAYLYCLKIQWTLLIVATSGPALSGHNSRWLLQYIHLYFCK